VRLTLDEEIIKRYGHNFDSKKYSKYEEIVERELLDKAKQTLAEGKSVSKPLRAACSGAMLSGLWTHK